MAGFRFNIDVTKLAAMSAAFRELSDRKQNRVVQLALNRTMDMTYTKVVRVLTEETGAQQARVRKVLKKIPASATNLSAQIVARDQYMSLKDFRPAQRAKGVSAAPWKQRRVFKGTFFGKGGHVYKRTSKKRLPIEKLWGPAIPKEMLRGETEKAFNEVASTHLGRRMLYEADRAIGAVKAKYGL